MAAKSKMSWTDDRIATLKKMWKANKSAAEIAKSLGKGVTRNAVIGKANRLGLSNRAAAKKKDVKVKSAPKTKTKTAKKPAKKEKSITKRKVEKSVPSAKMPTAKRDVNSKKALPTFVETPQEIPEGGGVALVDLTERMCKWPIGDPKDPDFTFCGLDIKIGTPYCDNHAAMAYQTSTRRGAKKPVVIKEKPEAETEEEDLDEDEEDLLESTDDDADDILEDNED